MTDVTMTQRSKKRNYHHGIADDKRFPMVCRMPTYALRKVMCPESLPQNSLWAITAFENFERVFLKMTILMLGRLVVTPAVHFNSASLILSLK